MISNNVYDAIAAIDAFRRCGKKDREGRDRIAEITK